MPLVTQILDLEAMLVLDMNPSTGYRRTDLKIGGKEWRRATITSPWVHGEFDTQWSLSKVQIALTVKAFGDEWPDVEARVEALEDAVSEPFLFRVQDNGVTRTWICRVANTDPSYTREDRAALRRFVTLDIPAQPHPTLTGV